MLAKVRQIAGDLRPQSRHSRLLYAGAAVLLTSALVHTIVLAATGFEWGGPLSWRKPIVFGFSTGLLLATVGWVLDRLPERRRVAGPIAWTLLLSSLLEVGLITVQTWRGEASHFNTFEATNATIFALMGVSVGFMSLCLVATLIWSIIERPADPLIRVAVIAGLALVTTGLGIGQWLIELGNDYAAQNGIVPATVLNGEAGQPKFPHAVAFHGIQIFIITALMLRRTRDVESSNRRVWGVVLSYAALLGVAATQSVLGQAPTHASIWTVAMVGSVTVLVALLASIGARYLRSADVQRTPVSVG